VGDERVVVPLGQVDPGRRSGRLIPSPNIHP